MLICEWNQNNGHMTFKYVSHALFNSIFLINLQWHIDNLQYKNKLLKEAWHFKQGHLI